MSFLPNTHVYSKTEVQKELSAQNKKQLPKLPKGHFKLIKVLAEGVGFALYQFDSVSACGNMDSLQHSCLPTPVESLIDLPVESANLFVGHMFLLVWGGKRVVNNKNRYTLGERVTTPDS